VITGLYEQLRSALGQLPVVVVPCFNEEERLDVGRFSSLVESGQVRLLFVNDGSTDETLRVVTALAAGSDRVEILDLPTNVGKAEAVRRGLLHAIDSNAHVVGYYDADLATPPDELLRLLAILADNPHLSVVMGSRVALLGRSIDRSPGRHYLGRVLASIASFVLRVRVYDTQCGAKVMRVTPAVVEALRQPFRSTWVFDVELIGRLLRGSGSVAPLPPPAFEEVPLREWHDVPGSKVTFAGMAGAVVDLAALGVGLRASRTDRSPREAADGLLAPPEPPASGERPTPLAVADEGAEAESMEASVALDVSLQDT
jgi:dolichyl-phosphate beta-glucosyltransferase